MNSILLYKLLASVYDFMDIVYFADYKKSPRKAVMQSINNNDIILDVCTGTATNAINIATSKPGTKIVGIDLSKDMLRIAKAKVKKKQISNIKLKHMDATELTFKDKVFDKILISLVLHELDEPITDKLLQQAKRVLKDDGEIIITEWEPSKQRWRRILFMPIHLFEPKSYRIFIKKDLKLYFEKLGLKITGIKHCNYSKVIKLCKI